MKYIFYYHEHSPVSLVGGKGHHLQNLRSWKAQVAPFIVLGTTVFDEYKKGGRLPLEVVNKVRSFLGKYPRVAMRSSMIGEDQLDASFAGLFETILGIHQDNWEEGLKKIYASMDLPRVKQYTDLKKISQALQMAIVIQEEIPVHKSGIMFSRSPVYPTSAFAIDAGKGMGEGVVSGRVDVDHYLLNRLGELIVGPKNGLLNPRELSSLLQEGLRLEKFFNGPVDIEWGFRDHELYIFQIRPITRIFSDLHVLADTNLSESYPGAVSPFTASFVQRAYQNIFHDSTVLLGGGGEKLKKLNHHYAQLLTVMDDHLYYNLEHYYAVLRSLPGGEKNIENWHKMIGAKIEGADIPLHDTYLSPIETASTVIQLVKIAFNRKRVFRDFLQHVESLSIEIESNMPAINHSKDAISYIYELIYKPLGFGITLVNDVYIMIGLGILTKSLKKRGLPDSAVIDLLQTKNSLDSVKPLDVFNELLEKISLEFITDFIKLPMSAGLKPYVEAFKILNGSGWRYEVKALEDFLDLYGDRSFEELKLESLPLRNDPDLLKKFLKWGKNKKSISRAQTHPQGQVELGLFEQKVLNFTLECIEFRETSRLWRGRFYHYLRRLVIQLSELLPSEDPRWRVFSLKDYFSLNHHEWKAFLEEKLSFEEVERMMVSRREWQIKDHHYPEYAIWSPLEKIPYRRPKFLKPMS